MTLINSNNKADRLNFLLYISNFRIGFTIVDKLPGFLVFFCSNTFTSFSRYQELGVGSVVDKFHQWS